MDASLSTQLTQALVITLLGMSLVFGAIILLWGLIAALVRLLPEIPETTQVGIPQADSPETSQVTSAPLSGVDEILPTGEELVAGPALVPSLDSAYAAAAAAAVAVALALAVERPTPQATPTLPVLQPVSAWQTVMCTNILNKRGSVR